MVCHPVVKWFLVVVFTVLLVTGFYMASQLATPAEQEAWYPPQHLMQAFSNNRRRFMSSDEDRVVPVDFFWGLGGTSVGLSRILAHTVSSPWTSALRSVTFTRTGNCVIQHKRTVLPKLVTVCPYIAIYSTPTLADSRLTLFVYSHPGMDVRGVDKYDPVQRGELVLETSFDASSPEAQTFLKQVRVARFPNPACLCSQVKTDISFIYRKVCVDVKTSPCDAPGCGGAGSSLVRNGVAGKVVCPMQGFASWLAKHNQSFPVPENSFQTKLKEVRRVPLRKVPISLNDVFPPRIRSTLCGDTDDCPRTED